MPEGRHNRIGPRLQGEEKKEVPAKCRCIHPDCIFAAGENSPNRCNYLLITGYCRIKGLSEKERDTALCRHYRKGRRQQIDKEMHLKTPFA